MGRVTKLERCELWSQAWLGLNPSTLVKSLNLHQLRLLLCKGETVTAFTSQGPRKELYRRSWIENAAPIHLGRWVTVFLGGKDLINWQV